MRLIRSTVLVLVMMILALLNLIETAAGLPNTCSVCGKPIDGSWFAPNTDAARSGQGLCRTCAGKEARDAAPDSQSPPSGSDPSIPPEPESLPQSLRARK